MNFSALILSCVLLLAGLFGLLFFNFAQNQEKASVRGKAQVYAALLNQGGTLPVISPTLRITVVSPSGEVREDTYLELDGTDNRIDREEVAQAFLTGEGESVRYSSTFGSSAFYHALLLDNGEVLRLSRTLNSLSGVFRVALPTLVGITGLVMLMAYVLTRALTRRIVAPLSQIRFDNQLAYDYTHKDFYEELRPYIDQIESQKKEIAAQLNQRREFSANVSHELKTPLTSISILSEMMANGMVKLEDVADFSSKISKHASRLILIIEDIIRLSEFDENKVDKDFAPVEVLEVAEAVMLALEDKADEKKVTLALVGEPTQLTANSRLIDELIYNLVENGIKYNQEGGSVTIGIADEGEGCKISVEDTGIGIPEAHQGRIFERFYRVDKSRSQRTGGSGLGLSIVKHITEHHNGRIALESREGVGTRITCYFPDTNGCKKVSEPL